MELKCVVGNCRQSNDVVKRCYRNMRSVNDREIDDWAYLDLCWFHREDLNSSVRTVVVDGWDPDQ